MEKNPRKKRAKSSNQIKEKAQIVTDAGALEVGISLGENTARVGASEKNKKSAVSCGKGGG